MAQPACARPVDTTRFNDLLDKGDSIYSQKQSYSTFEQSLVYFDSAQLIADQSGEAALLARAIFARGRVYDAWNKNPQKTIDLFSKAAELLRQTGDPKYYYVKHLVAHAYDKIRDSTHAVTTLRELIIELNLLPPATLNQFHFIPEMALIATEVHDYALADTILKTLTHRSRIWNDPNTYNYLDHYYLTQARLDVYWRHKKASVYVDSLAQAYTHLSALFDKLYYSQQLSQLYEASGDYKKAYQFASGQDELQSDLYSGSDYEKLQRALSASELAAQRRKAEYQIVMDRARNIALWGSSILLLVITILSLHLYRRNQKYKVQSVRLQEANHELDNQIGQVELLNKEIQHRVKNNLYTIYSLLHMQQDSTDDEEVIAHLEAARMRVESVAALHDHLQAGRDTVDFSAYLKILVNKAVDCLADRRKAITHIVAEPVALPFNTCFALSLILNEWVTNSVKYAQTRNNTVNMDIEILNQRNGVCVSYRDDGLLYPDHQPSKGLGTEIVRLLSSQIKAVLTRSPENPYHYQLYIPNGQSH
ncbi:MAG: sensor histidine kinase [Sphingobacteriales bacterium]|nr:MAG: sensor histidine kinase [Sphingobacteriales bacterium]